MDDLAICAIFRNEGRYLHEWLSYHYAQGVRRFVLYDNASTDDSRAVIEAWPRRDIVTVVDWPGQGGQLHAYVDMATRFRDATEWCAFIDCDEFLCPQSSLSLTDVLRAVGREANGLYVHWWMFGSSGHVERQPGLVTETFRWRAPDRFGSHFFGKSVMRLAAMTHVGLHVFRCQGRMVNDAGWEIDQQSAGGQAQQSHRLLALNHYFTKSREEWRQRRALGKADKTESDPEFYRAEPEFAQHDINAVQDDRAALFMQAARAMFYQAQAVPNAVTLPNPAHLLTVHGTLLCWDEAAARVVHCPPERITAERTPLACEFGGAPALECRLAHPASVDGQRVFSMMSAGVGSASHLRAGELFLCAEAGSNTVRANRSEAREWETFLPLSPDDAGLLLAMPPQAGRMLPGFQLQLDEDRYDLRWAVPRARLAAVPTRAAPAATSLTMYDLSDEMPAAQPASHEAAIGGTLAQLHASGRIEAVHVFSPAARFARKPPFVMLPAGNPAAPYGRLFADPAYRSYSVPELACYALTNASIFGADGLIRFDGALVRDSTGSLEPWRKESLAAASPSEGASVLPLKRAVPAPSPHAGTLFCGFVGAWRNYAHWLTECLPRLFAFRALQARHPGLRLALPRLEPGSAQAQTISLLGLDDRQIVTVADDEALAGEIWAGSTIDPWAVPAICREAAEALAEASASVPDGSGSRIYIRRGADTRRLVNLASLRDSLDRHGFRVVTMQDMTLADQVRTMRSARLIVGENGAALANIMFCSPGARVLELFNEAWANPAHWTLASLCGLDYGWIEGRHVPSALAPLPSHNADYEVPLDQFEIALRALLDPSG